MYSPARSEPPMAQTKVTPERAREIIESATAATLRPMPTATMAPVLDRALQVCCHHGGYGAALGVGIAMVDRDQQPADLEAAFELALEFGADGGGLMHPYFDQPVGARPLQQPSDLGA